ncbi:ataxin-2 homolog [Oscarella lobularis]|uniref:ataxin-2 homolog n=1 Tax=Oscarella lobularis TaxID=121494 RepID=UPI003314029C
MSAASSNHLSRSEELGKVVEALLHNVSTLVPAVKTLASLGRTYQKAMADCTRAAASFWDVFNQIAQHAADYRTSTRFIGDAMMEISEVHRQIELQRGDVLRSYLNDFVLPLEAKVESEEKALAVLQRSYRDDCELRIQMVEEADEELRSVRKKFRKENPGVPFQDDREAQLLQTLHDRETDLFDVRSYGLRKALILERKIHSIVVEKFCHVIKSNIVYHGRSHNGLSRKINDWVSLVSDATETQDFNDLLKDPTLVPRNRWLEDDSRNFLDGPLPSRAPQPNAGSTAVGRKTSQAADRMRSQSADNTLVRPASPLARWRPEEQGKPTRQNFVNGETDGSKDFYPFQSHVSGFTGFAAERGGGGGGSGGNSQLFQPLSDSPESRQFGSLWTQENSPIGRIDRQEQPSALSVRSLGDLTAESSETVAPMGQVKSSSFEGLAQQSHPLQQPPPPPPQQHQFQNSHQLNFQSQVKSSSFEGLSRSQPQQQPPPQQQFQNSQQMNFQPPVPTSQQHVQLAPSQPFQAPVMTIQQQPQLAPVVPSTSAQLQFSQPPLQIQPPVIAPSQPHVQQPIQSEPQSLMQASIPVAATQQVIGANPQSYPALQQQPMAVPVQMQPQVVFLQQPSQAPVSQPVKSKIAPSSFDGPKYGMKFRALYTFSATTPSQLSFKEGDFIDAVGEPRDGWQYGENGRTRKSGWFPANYAEKMVALRDPRVGTGTTPRYLRRNNADTSVLRPAIPAPDYRQRTTVTAPVATVSNSLPVVSSVVPIAASISLPPATAPVAQTTPEAQAPPVTVTTSVSSASNDARPDLAASQSETNVAVGQSGLTKFMGVEQFE